MLYKITFFPFMILLHYTFFSKCRVFIHQYAMYIFFCISFIEVVLQNFCVMLRKWEVAFDNFPMRSGLIFGGLLILWVLALGKACQLCTSAASLTLLFASSVNWQMQWFVFLEKLSWPQDIVTLWAALKQACDISICIRSY